MIPPQPSESVPHTPATHASPAVSGVHSGGCGGSPSEMHAERSKSMYASVFSWSFRSGSVPQLPGNSSPPPVTTWKPEYATRPHAFAGSLNGVLNENCCTEVLEPGLNTGEVLSVPSVVRNIHSSDPTFTEVARSRGSATV